MNTKKKVHNLLYRVISRPSGRRFLYTYTKINRFINHSLFFKTLLLTIGISLTLIGVILLFTPGPGILLILAGSALLSSVSKRIAVLLDQLEKKIETFYKKEKKEMLNPQKKSPHSTETYYNKSISPLSNLSENKMTTPQDDVSKKILSFSLNELVTKADILSYKNEIQNKLSEQEEIRLEIDMSKLSDMTGEALFEDLKFEISLLDKLHRFSKIAVISDKQFIKPLIEITQFFLPSIEIKLFSSSEKEQAFPFLSGPARKEPELKSEVNVLDTNHSDLFAYEIKGILTKQGIEKIINSLQTALKEKRTINLLVQMDQYKGVDLRGVSLRSLLEFKLASLGLLRRYAVVGPREWMKQLIGCFRPLLSFEVRTFEVKEKEQAQQWLLENKK